MRCALRCALPLAAAHRAAGHAATAAGSMEAHHTHSSGPAESVHEYLTRDSRQQEPWTGQEAENNCATICILTGCGPLRPRVLRARATGDFQTAICRLPRGGRDRSLGCVMTVTRRDSQLVCGRSVPPQCNTHAYSNEDTPYSPWPNVDNSCDLWMLHRICEG